MARRGSKRIGLRLLATRHDQPSVPTWSAAHRRVPGSTRHRDRCVRSPTRSASSSSTSRPHRVHHDPKTAVGTWGTPRAAPKCTCRSGFTCGALYERATSTSRSSAKRCSTGRCAARDLPSRSSHLPMVAPRAGTRDSASGTATRPVGENYRARAVAKRPLPTAASLFVLSARSERRGASCATPFR